MSRIRANTIVNGAGTGAPNFPRGAIISGISTINAEISVGTGTSISSPATNELALGTNNLERLRITSAGLVGIGTDGPTKALQISQNSDCAIRIDANNSNANARTWEIVVGGNASNNAEMVFRTRQDDGTGGSECARITRSGSIKLPSGGGIDFSATTDGSGTMTSELLDDYEEGTWTPTYSGGVSSVTYGNNYGYYVKIGRQVTVWCNIMTNAVTISSTGTALLVAGLPFGSTTDSESSSAVNVGQSARWSSQPPHSGLISNNATVVQLYNDTYATTAEDPTATNAGDMNTGNGNKNILRFVATYRV